MTLQPSPSAGSPRAPEPSGRVALLKRLALGGAVLLLVGLAAMALVHYLAKPAGKAPKAQAIALINQPPPPPPKPPEKPPEPPKVREEVKVDTPRPDAPKTPDDNSKPASDKPLGVDAEPGAGSDGFGLAGSKGGRDFLSTGGGGGAAYYSGLLQRQFFEAMSRNRNLLREEFRVVVRIWLGDDGRVTRVDVVDGSGKAETDSLIQQTLQQMAALKDVPPASMRPISIRLSNRS